MRSTGISDERISALAHPLESSRSNLALIGLVPAGLALLGIALATLGMAVAVGGFVFWLVGRIGEAALRGNAVEISEDSFPEIASQIDSVKSAMAYEGHITAFVIQEGEINAALWRVFGRRFLTLNSGLVKALTASEREFVVAQFIGALKTRRLRLHEASSLLNAMEHLRVLNLFVLPYLRATVYTGDRIGLEVCGEPAVAASALRKMTVGAELAAAVSDAALVDQGLRLRSSPFRFLAIIASTHPHMTDRIVELTQYAAAKDLRSA